MLKNNFLKLVIIFFVFSCQPIEVLDEIVFDYDQFPKIVLSAESKDLNNLYESKFNDTYIDNSLKNPPSFFLNQWFLKNVNTFGTENKLTANIIDSSLKKTEIPNIDNKKYKEKTIFLYELSFLVEFILYDDSNFLLATSIVEAKRSTTSGKYISIYESERIIDNLIYEGLNDFSNEAINLLNIHMKNFIL